VAGGLSGIHEILGGLVVVAFIVMVILAAMTAAGRDERWTRMASLVAAGLLALQYVVGVLLLANGFRNSNEHYVIGLLVLIPVALQHSSARRLSPQTRGVALLIWALAAVFLTVIAYLTGTWGAGTAT
jgi:heme A synthase